VEAENDMQFINLSSDESYDETNYKQGVLPEMLDTFAFSSEIGETYGPYKENNTYKIAKLSAINFLPDSVKASHILIKVETQEDYTAAHTLLDSLKLLAEAGADFAELAKQHSLDGSAAGGGDIGWFKENQILKALKVLLFQKI
jgi:peptidyl-prolyl cis-trans isomerase D